MAKTYKAGEVSTPGSLRVVERVSPAPAPGQVRADQRLSSSPE